MENSGILSLIKLNERESSCFLNFLRKLNNTPAFDFIFYLIGEDYMEFLDLLAGSTLKIPNRKILFRDLEYIKLYVYVRDRGFTEEAVGNAAKIYNKKVSYVRRAVAKVSQVIDGKEVDIVKEPDKKK